MAIENKYRIHEFAKDMNLKSKDVMALIGDKFEMPKNHMQILTMEELDFLFDYYTKENMVESFDEYIREGFEAAEKQKAEQKKAEEEAKPQKTEKKPSPSKEKAETKKPENKKQVESKKEDAPKEDKEKPGIRYIDTKERNVDLSKYDEKLEDLAPERAKKMSANANLKQKIKKGNKNDKFNKKNTEAEKLKKLELEKAKIKHQLKVKIPDEISVTELAKMLKVTNADLIKKLMTLGVMAAAGQIIDFDTAAIAAEEFGAKVEREIVVTIEEKLFDESEDKEENLKDRPPVVVVMGHVDHGKTSLLDAIRNTSVTTSEAGGITQHIGAYTVKINGKDITFLDTPGHAAFTSMRARGAQVTDIAILVVAADDGIMPQTVEAINHAKAAGVSIIVAINKMDKETANPDRIKQALTEYELVPEEWGGDVICVPASAIKHDNIDTLLEMVLLQAEMAELKANPDRMAMGTVIEARLDKGRGPVATVLVQNGTLNTSDVIIAGTSVGRVRAMTDDKGRKVSKAGPSIPVEIIGLAEVPTAGETFRAVENEKMARELAEQRKNNAKEEMFKANSKVSLDELFNQINSGIKELNVIVKADVQGSVEAVKSSLEKLSNEEVKVKVIHGAVGGITESDIMLAQASNAIVVGFNVRPDSGAQQSAKVNEVDVRLYRIIYDCIEEIEAAMKGMLDPTYKEVVLGQAEVRMTFKVSGVGTIAGSYVKDGKITRNAKVRLLRDSIVIFEGEIDSLKRFKDDAKEVAEGFECGIGIANYNDVKEGDIIEAYIMEEVKN